MTNATLNQVALVTGASSGMGEQIARQLLSDGYVVYAAARRLDRMSGLKTLGANTIRMDITNKDDIDRVVQTIEQQHGGVDVLVNNAGFGSYGAMEDTSMEDARYQFEVNLFGLAELTKSVLPYMRGKKSGKIINISSIGGKIYTPLGSWYHATKHALEGWSDCLRIEVAAFGIDVVIVEPGLIQTEFGDVLLAPMIERSGKSAYAPMTDSLVAATTKSYENNAGSHPAVIANLVSRALTATRPKTRYSAGKLARPLLLLRSWLSDRMFDRLVLSMVK